MSIPASLKLIHAMVFYLAVISLFILILKPANSGDIVFETASLTLNGKEYFLEIAKSTRQRRRGLMFRDKLDGRHGMLFVYSSPGNHRIWMKNTLIPLTVIWIDIDYKVIGIKKLKPCTSNPCPAYGFLQPSKYILELNSENHNFEPGSRFEALAQFD